jgi:hypothetical protein
MKICPKVDTCYKLKMVLDKDYDVIQLYPMVMNDVCDKCEEMNNENTSQNIRE